VNQTHSRYCSALLAGLLASSCGVPQTNVANSEDRAQSIPATEGIKVSDTSLPINQRFKNLDEYLGWLRLTQAPVDGAWYKQIRPGVYELQTGNLRVLGAEGEKKKTFTREELERKFGFRS